MPDADRFLSSLQARDIWGIGPRYARLLGSSNIHTAYDLKEADQAWIKKRLTIAGLHKGWEMRRRRMSPEFTTRWAAIPRVKA
jgi:DNA polymerase V